jgi:hypothetical protein
MSKMNCTEDITQDEVISGTRLYDLEEKHGILSLVELDTFFLMAQDELDTVDIRPLPWFWQNEEYDPGRLGKQEMSAEERRAVSPFYAAMHNMKNRLAELGRTEYSEMPTRKPVEELAEAYTD